LLAFIIRRLLWLPFILFCSSVMVVGLMQFLSPEQRATAFIRTKKDSGRIDEIIKENHLDANFVQQYGAWFSRAIRGDLGVSKTSGEDVVATFRKRLPASLELGLFMYLPVMLFGLFLGVLAATKQNSWVDQSLRLSSLVLWSIPTYVLAIWVLAIFYGGFGWFGLGRVSQQFVFELGSGSIPTPTGIMTLDALLAGRWDLFWDALKHMVLPIFIYTIIGSASDIRVMRSSMLEALHQDFIRTARAKGLSKRTVDLKHALRNALIPFVTSATFAFVNLITGLIIVETIFGFDGIGRWSVESALRLDTPATLAFGLFISALFTLANIASDILYAVVDPRIRYS
jgi:dipeptide transport system permease protein